MVKPTQDGLAGHTKMNRYKTKVNVTNENRHMKSSDISDSQNVFRFFFQTVSILQCIC